MAKRRRFTSEFKAEVAMEALSGQSSQPGLCRRPNLSEEQFSKWKRQLPENAAILFEPTNKQSKDTIDWIAQLAQLFSFLTLALDIEKRLGETPKQKHSAELNMSENFENFVIGNPGSNGNNRSICLRLYSIYNGILRKRYE